MKTLTKILLAVTAVVAFSVVQPVEARRTVDAGPTIVQGGPSTPATVPDGGSTIFLLGYAFRLAAQIESLNVANFSLPAG